MIKINLLGEENSDESNNNLWVAGYVASLMTCLLLFYFMQSSLNSTIEDLTAQSQSLEAQLAKLKETTKEVRELEQKKDDLRNKLAVIATLKRNKVGPVRVMDDLNASIPERAWLDELKEKDNILRIKGVALDNQTVSAFAARLGKSDYYPNVEIIESKNIDQKGIAVKEFTLQAKVSYMGKIAPKADPSKAAADTKPATATSVAPSTPAATSSAPAADAPTTGPTNAVPTDTGV